MSTDPTDIRSCAISVDDIVAAYEAARGGKPVVLRLTPPFSGRMRARIHLARERDDPETIHIDPCMLIDTDSPAYPTPEETEDRLRASEREYSVDTHHALHVEAVEEWRAAVRSHVVSEITIETSEGPHTVDVKPLG